LPIQNSEPLTAAPVVCPDGNSCNAKPCEFCGTDFTPVRSSGRFCKPACRVDAHRRPAAEKRRATKRQYHSERRAAVVAGAKAGERRVRDVGAGGAPGNAVRARLLAAGWPVGWYCAWPRERVARG
jgi:hypothetical protein